MKKSETAYWVSGAICFICLLLGMCFAFGATTNTREALAFLLFSLGFGAAAVMIRMLPIGDKSQTRPSSFTTVLFSIVMLCVAASKMWSVNMVYGVLSWVAPVVVVVGAIGIGIYFYKKRKAKK